MTDPIAPRPLVIGCLSPDQETRTSAILDLAEAASIPVGSIRVAVSRLVDSGDVVQHGRGRTSVLTLTEAGRARVIEDRTAVRFAFAQDAGMAEWDQRWRLYSLSVPESLRSERDAIRRRLVALGCAPAGPGLYVSALPLGSDLTHIDTQHLVTATADRLNVRGVSDPRTLAEILWPAAPLLAPYDELAALIDEVILRIHRDDPQGSEADVLRLHLAAHLERAMRHDPLIPPELRPAPWAPSVIRSRWLEVWAALTRRSPDSPFFQSPRAGVHEGSTTW